MDLSRGRAISRENETSHSASATVMKSLLRLSDAMDDSTKATCKKDLENFELNLIKLRPK